MLKCNCGYEWDFTGAGAFPSCPKCRSSNSKKRARERYLKRSKGQKTLTQRNGGKQ